MTRKCQLTTLQLYRLDRACVMIRQGFRHPPYLVGSAGDSADWRDVDVRLILPDDEFDALFGNEHGVKLWEAMCASLALWIETHTGLPIDFQIQRMTEANETYPVGDRNPLGRNPLGLSGARVFAGFGDATGFVEN